MGLPPIARALPLAAALLWACAVAEPAEPPLSGATGRAPARVAPEEEAPLPLPTASSLPDDAGLSGARIEPASPSALDVLACLLEGGEGEAPRDAASVPGARVVWRVNGRPVAVAARLDAAFRAGDVVTCTVLGTGARDAPGGRVVVRNASPSAEEARVEPPRPTSADAIRCAPVGFADPDGDADASRVAWRINGRPAGEGRVLRARVRKGDVVACQLTPSDGAADGEPVAATATVTNGPPAVALVTVVSEDPGDPHAALTCRWAGFDDPDGDPDWSWVRWLRNGETLEDPDPRAFEPGDVMTCEAVPFDKEATGAAARGTLTLGNRPPSVRSAAITPRKPAAGDTLTCSWRGFRDPEGGVDRSRVTWTVNNRPAGEGPSLSGGFRAGDKVTCWVQPWDGASAGVPVASWRRVRNTPPRVEGVRVEGAPGALRCAWDAFVDPDGDPDRSRVRWTVDDAPAGEGAVLTRRLHPGARVACEVVPSDGEEEGPPAQAARVVGNDPPSALGAVIAPERPRVGDTLRCLARGFRDPDGDPDRSRVTWRVGGREAGQGPTLAGAFRAGDAVTCELTPSDGHSDGPAVTAEATIGNTPPQAAAARIVPALPSPGDALRCELVGFEDADGDPARARFVWRLGGEVLAEGQELARPIGRGEDVTCEATPLDGEDAGEPRTATARVGNAAPTVAEVALEPAAPTAWDAPRCAWRGFEDADGDPDRSRVRWRVNGRAAGEGPALDATLREGDEVACTVTPHDGISAGPPRTARAVVQNAPPRIGGVSLHPETPRAGDRVTCRWRGFEDPEGARDRSRVRWTVDGAPRGEGHSPAGPLRAGQTVTCEVVPFDGEHAGEPVAASAVVANTPPRAAAAVIAPPRPGPEDVLTCDAAGFDDPDGDADASRVIWSVEGRVLGVGPRLAGAFAEGDEVTCRLVPFDGSVEGTPVEVSVVVGPPRAPAAGASARTR